MSQERGGRSQDTELPRSWCWVSFDDAVEVISDEGKRIAQADYHTEGPLPVIDQGEAFIGGYTDRQDQAYSGSLPIIIFGDHTRRVKYVDFPFVVGAQGVKLLGPRAIWFPKFLSYVLPTLDLASRGYSRHFQYLRKLRVPLAPPAEQARIVDEIEKQFTRLDAAVAALKRVQANLKRYRAAVLKAACEGRLVPTEAELARREGRSYEPASTLLLKLRQMSAGPKLAKHRAGRLWGAGVVPELTDAERANLPEGWTWAEVRELGPDQENVVQVGPMSMRSQDFDESGVPVLNVGCVKWGEFDESKLDYMPQSRAREFSRYRIAPRDILFTRSGAVGRCAVAKDYQSGWLMTFHLLRVRTDENFCVPEYLRIVFEGAPHVRRQTRAASVGTTRAGFNTNLLAGLDVPLPPHAEQNRIVAEVDRQLTELNAIAASTRANLKRANSLSQAILKTAFQGRLVAQDPADEPASSLMERIHSDRETEPKSSANRARRRKALHVS